MSIEVSTDDLNEQQKKKLTTLVIKIEAKFAYIPVRYFYPSNKDGKKLTIPFAFAVTELLLKRPARKSFPESLPVSFEGRLRDEQIIVRSEAIDVLNKTGSVILSMFCGFGKTITAINMACALKFKCLIVVNKIVLLQQWESAISEFCPSAQIQVLTPNYLKKGLQKIQSVNFILVNALNIGKIDNSFFDDVGTVIVDEAHLIVAEKLSNSLLSLKPRYLIALTATPYRPDGLDKLLLFYFGKNKIIRELHREHIVYKIDTGFKPTIEMTANNMINWSLVLESQSNDAARNQLIVSIIQRFEDRQFLVLVKRVQQGFVLEQALQNVGESVTTLLGSNQQYDLNARILIGTVSKVGVGFDRKQTDALLLAGDVEEYFIQYLGRCMRTVDTIPLIFDLVDDLPLLKKHFATRKKIYISHGGRILQL